MTQRYAAPGFRRAGDVLAHGIVDSQPTVLGEQHDTRREELLAHRSDLEDGLRRDRDLVFEIGHTVPRGLDHLSGTDDGDCDAGNVFARHFAVNEHVDRIARGRRRAWLLSGHSHDLRGARENEREEARTHGTSDVGDEPTSTGCDLHACESLRLDPTSPTSLTDLSQGGTTMGLIWTLIIGLLVGAIAKFFMPGRDPGGILV